MSGTSANLSAPPPHQRGERLPTSRLRRLTQGQRCEQLPRALAWQCLALGLRGISPRCPGASGMPNVRHPPHPGNPSTSHPRSTVTPHRPTLDPGEKQPPADGPETRFIRNLRQSRGLGTQTSMVVNSIIRVPIGSFLPFCSPPRTIPPSCREITLPNKLHACQPWFSLFSGKAEQVSGPELCPPNLYVGVLAPSTSEWG